MSNKKLSSSSAKLDFIIMFMRQSSSKEKINAITLSIPAKTEMQSLVQYLKETGKLPFQKCIFTVKPAQKGQFTMNKTLKQLSTQCKQLEKTKGPYVLLCYESNVKSTFSEEPSTLTQFTEKGSNKTIIEGRVRGQTMKRIKESSSDCQIF